MIYYAYYRLGLCSIHMKTLFSGVYGYLTKLSKKYQNKIQSYIAILKLLRSSGYTVHAYYDLCIAKGKEVH